MYKKTADSTREQKKSTRDWGSEWGENSASKFSRGFIHVYDAVINVE